MTERWLLADIGGTNTRVGLAGPSGLRADSLRSYPNAAFDSPAALLRAYLGQMQPGPVHALCAGVAGPVRAGTAQLTNHPWLIDAAELRAATGAAHVHLLNDLQAQGYALDDLAPDQITPLFPGACPAAGATRLVLGLGTGANAAVVHVTSAGLLVPPAESGHASLPYAPGKLAALIDHLGQTAAHRPMECALSGPGLGHIHHWLTGMSLPPDRIIAAHLAGDAHATETLHLFSRLLGQIAGDLALAHLPMGGLFLIGGTARAIAPCLAGTGFHDAFTDKGPYAPILHDIPVSLITDDTAALLGCVRHLRQILSAPYHAAFS